MDLAESDSRIRVERSIGVFQLDFNRLVCQRLPIMELDFSTSLYERTMALRIYSSLGCCLSPVGMNWQCEAVFCALPDDDKAADFDVEGTFVLG